MLSFKHKAVFYSLSYCNHINNKLLLIIQHVFVKRLLIIHCTVEKYISTTNDYCHQELFSVETSVGCKNAIRICISEKLHIYSLNIKTVEFQTQGSILYFMLRCNHINNKLLLIIQHVFVRRLLIIHCTVEEGIFFFNVKGTLKIPE